jgi:ribosomal protein S14
MTDKYDRLLALKQRIDHALRRPRRCAICGSPIFPTLGELMEGKREALMYCGYKCAGIAISRVNRENFLNHLSVERSIRKWGSLSRTARMFNISRERARQIARGR